VWLNENAIKREPANPQAFDEKTRFMKKYERGIVIIPATKAILLAESVILWVMIVTASIISGYPGCVHEKKSGYTMPFDPRYPSTL
jgi:hypothetical protein